MAGLASEDAAAGGNADWPHARLIPTYGIRSEEEQEKRATACLLAVMHGVPEFGHALLGELGAPRSPNVETFAEVRFKNAAGKTDIPDGAIVCERGAKHWTCLVEAWQVRPPQIPSKPDPPADHAASLPDILPLQPKDLVPAGTSNEDMSDFQAPAPPSYGVTPTVAAESSNGAATDSPYESTERSVE